MQLIGALFTGGGTAAGTAGTVGTGLATGSGISIAGILQGAATVLGVVSAINAGNAEAEMLNEQARDAERETENETLKGIERRRSLKAAMFESLGEQDVAYAASGLDLSFGSANVARTRTFREADLGITSDNYTQTTRTTRLMERAANYRSQAKRARSAGLLRGLAGGLDSASRFAQR